MTTIYVIALRQMTTYITVSNAADSMMPTSLHVTLTYTEDDDSVPVDRWIYVRVPVPSERFPVNTGIIRRIHRVRVDVNFADGFTHEYDWTTVDITEQTMQIEIQQGVRHPSISLNGQHAYKYDRDVVLPLRIALAAFCMCWCPWEFCCRDNYAQRDECEYSVIN